VDFLGSEPNPRVEIPFPVVFEVGQNAECYTTRDSFNASNPTQLAVTILRHQPNSTESPWDLLVLDLTTGSVVYQLTSDSPLAIELTGTLGLPTVPVVRYFDGDNLSFALVPWGTEPPPNQPAYTWNLPAGTLTSTPEYGQWIVNVNPFTGERVWLVEDNSLPTTQPFGPRPAFNVVMYDSTQSTYAIFHRPDAVLYSATFVDGGSLLAVSAQPGWAGDTPQPPDVEWTLIGRDGSTRPMPYEGVTPQQLVGTRDGYVAWAGDYETPSITLTYYRLNDDGTATATVLWQHSDPNWSFAWSVAAPVAGTYEPFPMFAQ
jgi:hypothetical protein